MVTKLRRFSRNIVVKIAAFMLIVVVVTVSGMQFVKLFDSPFGIDVLLMENYRSSWQYAGDLQTGVNWINRYALDGHEDQNVIENLEYYIKLKDGGVISNTHEDTIMEKRDDTDLLTFEKSEVILNENVTQYYGDSEPLDVFDDTNDTQDEPNTYVFAEFHPKGYYIQSYSIDSNDVERAYMRYTPQFLEQKQAEWISVRDRFDYRIVLGGLVVATLLAIYLMLVAGRKADSDEVHLHLFDRLFTEVQLTALGFLIYGAIALLGNVLVEGMMDGYSMGANSSLYAKLAAVIIVLALILFGILMLSFVRKLKARTFLKQSIIYKFFHFIFHWIATIFKNLFGWKAFEKYPLTKALFIRQCIFVCCSTLCLIIVGISFGIAMSWGGYSGFLVVTILAMLAEAGLLYWYLTGSVKGYNEINKGMNYQMEEQMKAERMKVSLVTNVSHDLKTPLTSIISYVDLLSKEELSPTARDYVMILAQKSDRLKHIVADLFDLSKVSSGDITLELEQLDIKRLVEQTLADMNDSISTSGLDFKVKLPIYAVYIMGDGKKLYRVMQNIIGNAIKYAMKGTRVFVDMESTGEKAIISVKNTSATEMDFTAEEILQRFFRGDKSRSTDGTGLGLSIAQGLTHACGGEFDLAVDGDLFKVTMIFPIDQHDVSPNRFAQNEGNVPPAPPPATPLQIPDKTI